jgi:hypothetical protein
MAFVQTATVIDRIVVIAGICIGLHGRPTSSHGENVKAVTLFSPTIFPIVYASILGKLLKRIGLYKAERGITMGVGLKCVM